MISFNTIPASTRVPGQMIEFDASRAVSGIAPIDNRVLLIGQRLASGTTPALTVRAIADASEGITRFGRGSMLARMIAAYRKVDRYSKIYAIALDDIGAGAAATGTITVTGTAANAGTIPLLVAGVQIDVPVAAAATAANVATAIVAAITANPDLPVTAAAAAGVVTLTCRHKGTVGNAIDVLQNYLSRAQVPTGIALAFAAMSGGATDPDIDGVWPVIGDEPYRTIVSALSDATTFGKIKAELDSRWGAQRMLESVAYLAKSGNTGALTAFGAARNSELVTILGIGDSPTWEPEAAAIYAAVCGFYTAIDPARPLQTLPLTGLIAPVEATRFTRAQRELLLADGIATYTVDSGGTCRIERSITTYQTDALGIDSIAYLDLETVTTLAYLRATLRARIVSKFPRHKLASDGTKYGVGQAIVTPSVIRMEIIALAREWEAAGLVENLDQFIADIIVERDESDVNRINALVPPDIVNQFRQFAAAIQFRL